MTEQFINYKVELVLHDFSRIRGYVNGIQGKDLSISKGMLILLKKELRLYSLMAFISFKSQAYGKRIID